MASLSNEYVVPMRERQEGIREVFLQVDDIHIIILYYYYVLNFSAHAKTRDLFESLMQY
jgi:hypothetical protein